MNEWAKANQMSEQMRTTAQLIDKHLTSYQKAEAKRTANWVDKQIKRIDAALKRNCTFEGTTITKCNKVS